MSAKKVPSLVFQERIKLIKNEFKELCNNTLDITRKSLCLIENYDEKVVEEIQEKNKEIAVLGYELERKCIRFIAVEQPLASDLMYIESSIRVISHVKRISHLSLNIAESSKELVGIEVPTKVLDDLQYMADYVQIMLSKGVRSFLNQDIVMAKELSDDDNKVDDLFDIILKQTTDLVAEKTDYALGIINLLFIARYLERIADRVVSMGSRIIFIKTHERPEIENLKDEID